MSDFTPETGSDGRPRPRYGEYATPEEQRARIRQPDATDALEAGIAPEPERAAPAPRSEPGPFGGPAYGATPRFDEPQAARPPHPVDRVVTIALLAYGAINVILAMPAYFDLSSYMGQVMSMLDISGTFTNTDAARIWGPVAGISIIVGFLVTAFVAVRALRRGRLAWWIPVVGAAGSFFVASLCLVVVILGDPAFQQMAIG